MTCRLYLGPISKEVVWAAYRARAGRDLAFCCSEGQVGPNAYTEMSGGVFAEINARAAGGRYLLAERDHMRTWNNYEEDRRYFTGFHVHTNDISGGVEAARQYGRDWCDFEWQIGPGEDDSQPISNLQEDMTCWLSFPMGIKVSGGRNVGMLDIAQIESTREACPQAKLRAHNADFLPRRTFSALKRLVDGVNVAPQFGAAQSLFYLRWATERGLSITEWEKACYEDAERLDRWELAPHCITKWYCIGHYHFDEIAFRDEAFDKCVSYLAGFIGELADA